jgi:serine/threonine-protein kinase
MPSDRGWDPIESDRTETLHQRQGRADLLRLSAGEPDEVRDPAPAGPDPHEQQRHFFHAPAVDFTGQRFGAYTAAEEIGRGGMSIVYRGRRSDGDFEKEVAIKVVLVEAGLELRQSETQILASLEHPHIARLLDAGVTPLGFR